MDGARTRVTWHGLFPCILAAVLATSLHQAGGPAAASPATPPDPTASPEPTHSARPGQAPRLPLPDFSKFTAHKVLKADGLTITISTGSGIETVALMGIEPPRAADPTTPQAERFLTNLLVGESVYLVDHEGGRRMDDKKRRVVYVHRAPDGLLANAELIRQGYAREQAEVPYQYQDAMRAYEGLARAAKKGLWVEPAGAKPAKPGDAKPADIKTGQPAADGKPAEPTPADADGKPGVPTGSAPTPGAEPAGTTPDKKADKAPRTGVTVYASKNGVKYHTITCKFLGKTKDPLSVEDAKKKGLLPCNECKPGV